MKLYTQMPFTRSQNSTSKTMRSSRPQFVGLQTHLNTSQTSSDTKFWSQWTNWYHAFLAEVTDEYPSLPVAERRSQATSRWVSYAAKQLRCSEPQVRAWLRTADQNSLVAAYA